MKGINGMYVLLITPNFFDYPKQICKEIRNMGNEVDWFDDRPSTNSFIKAAIRINKDFINLIIHRYFDNLMKSIEGKIYDKVILISGQSLSFNEQMILALKVAQPKAEYILYQWDALSNFPYIEQMEKHFDRCYSFDKRDVASHENLIFLPLFYSKRYEKIGMKKNSKYIYDFMFVGTAHPKKYKYVKEMSKKLERIYKKQFVYFFYPSRLVYIYRKLKDKELKSASYSEFHFKPVNGSQMDELISHSRCVLDSAQHGQIGLTIRVLEALGAKRKIITTNGDIVNYDFYRRENVYVYNGNFDFKDPFFTEPFKEIDEATYQKYSLKSWLLELIGDE